MDNYRDIYKILDKEKISIKELRNLTNNELVTSISPTKSDRILFHKYDVHLVNGELYYVYLKKSLLELMTMKKDSSV